MDLPVLQTARLTLRPLEPSDAARVAELAGDREIARNTESIAHPYTEEDARDFIARVREDIEAGRAAVLAIFLGDEGALVGAAGLEFETSHGRARLGYWIGRPYWDHGFATEAVQALVDWGFEETGFDRIYAEAFSRNPASRRVLEKIGMAHEGTLRRHFEKWGEKLDLEIYGILRDERGTP